MHKATWQYRIFQCKAFPQCLFIGSRNDLISHMTKCEHILSQWISCGLSYKMNDKESHSWIESLNDAINNINRIYKDNTFRLENVCKDNELLKNQIIQLNEIIHKKDMSVDLLKKEWSDFKIKKQKMLRISSILVACFVI